MAIEIVDLPIENSGSFHSYVNVYQRVGNADKASDVRDTSFFGNFWETSLADFAMNDTWGWGLAFPRMACLGFVKYSNLIEANCGEQFPKATLTLWQNSRGIPVKSY